MELMLRLWTVVPRRSQCLVAGPPALMELAPKLGAAVLRHSQCAVVRSAASMELALQLGSAVLPRPQQSHRADRWQSGHAHHGTSATMPWQPAPPLRGYPNSRPATRMPRHAYRSSHTAGPLPERAIPAKPQPMFLTTTGRNNNPVPPRAGHPRTRAGSTLTRQARVRGYRIVAASSRGCSGQHRGRRAHLSPRMPFSRFGAGA